jgi:hypothetical protein
MRGLKSAESCSGACQPKSSAPDEASAATFRSLGSG